MDNATRKRIKKAWEKPENQVILEDCKRVFGKYKKIILSTTGQAYRVPIEDIMTLGIKGVDLVKYPKWEEGDKELEN